MGREFSTEIFGTTNCTASCLIPLSYLELHITPLAGPARTLDLEDVFAISILDGVPGIDEGAVLLDVANGGARGRLDLHLLKAAETAPASAPQGTYYVDHLPAEQK